RENNYRSVLNFGHTVGHAIETLSNYQVRHGFAVAQGMRVAAALSHRLLGYPAERLSRLNKLLDDYHLLPVEMSGYSLEDIWNCIRFDKKARQQTPLFTLLDEQGKPKLFYPVSKKELKDGLLHA
ncbi:MAG: 3-dehydroquinate synthase, partial [Calditrichia bacterium]